MKQFLRIFLFLIFTIFFLSPSFSQIDSIYKLQLSQNVIRNYITSLQTESPLFNGKIHQPFQYPIMGSDHIYFISSSPNKGSIVYEGILFENVDLLYDLVKQELVMQNYKDIDKNIILDKSRVEAFSLLNHHFIKLQNNSFNGEPKANEYYDLQYNGNIKFLTRRIKSIIEPSTPGSLAYRKIKSTINHYIFKDSIYHPVTSKKSLLKILKENNHENKKYLKDNDLNFNKDTESSILGLVQLYDKQIATRK